MGLGNGLSEHIPVLLYIYSIGLFFLILFKDRRIGIFYFIPLIPLTIFFVKLHEFPFGKDIIDIILLAVIVGWFIQNKEIVKTTINKPLYAYIIFTYVALLNGSQYLGAGFPWLGDFRFQMWKNSMILPILFFVVLNNIKRLDEIKKLVFHVSIIYLLIGIKFVNNFTDPGYFDWSSKQDTSIFVHITTTITQGRITFILYNYDNPGENYIYTIQLR